ncbi:hypothetical protein A5757_15270 [Mycobacterium sp. 852013-51886_SCH5428379]|uniref:hypothetical protein n=1 Tax=Mycobacterium sp. 852013-51886_SCH5428379 TaxID=1834111 RepID=UPI00080097B7|nr:hypothetical protein [Mycobacterium sp. 852013-51886_SCH5428379]OBB58989.1 hypothetical protein A5757_15270 [Mycobacterium sp. 852013-51886_SCH5428379]
MAIDGDLTRARHLVLAGDDEAARDLLLSLTPADDRETLEITAQLGDVHLARGANDAVAECIRRLEALLAGAPPDLVRRYRPRARLLDIGLAAARGDHEHAAAELAALAGDDHDPDHDPDHTRLVTHARILCAGALCDDDLHVRSVPLWEQVVSQIHAGGADTTETDFLLVTGALGYGRFCVETGLLPEAEPWLRRAGARAHVRGWNIATARAALERAAAAWTAGDHEATERLAAEALPVLDAHGRADDTARCHLYLGFTRMAIGELAVADEHWAHAEASFRQLGKPLRLHRILLQRSWILIFWGRYAEATELIAQAREQLDASPRSNWLQYARLDDHLGTVWRADALADLGFDAAGDPDDTLEDVEEKHVASLGVIRGTPAEENERSARRKLEQAAELMIPAALAVDSVRYAIPDAQARMRWAAAVSAPLLAGAFAVAWEWENTALVAELIEYHSARGAFTATPELGGSGMPDLATTSVPLHEVDELAVQLAEVAGGSGAAPGSPSLTRLAPLPPLVMDPAGAPILDHYRTLAAQRYGREVAANEPAWSTWP